jgi:hypothetical protein
MAECGKQVGQGVVAYPCIIEVEGANGHAGPCAARENMRSMNERAKWDEARERAAKSGVPTLEELGMQGKPKTVVDGLLDPGSRDGRHIHPDELRRIKDGLDTSRTEEASLETRLVQTAGGVNISGLSAAFDQINQIEAAYKTFQDAFSEDVREGDQPLPTPNDDVHIHDLVLIDVADRKALGTSRYGTPLQAFNGRNALQDAYEEALDLTAYLRQVSLEHEVAAMALYELGEILSSYFDDHIPSDVEERLFTIAKALA